MKIATIASIFLLILGVRVFLYYQNQPRFFEGQEVNFEINLNNEPKIFSNRQVLSDNLGLNKLIIITSFWPQYHYQDKLKISGKLESRVLKNSSQLLVLYFPKIERGNQNAILKSIGNFREKFIDLFNRTLPLNYSSLLLGITFGIKGKMTEEFFNNLRTTGVLHVIAASGMNVTLFGGFISGVLGFFLKRQIALFLSIFGILFYVVLAGFEASIIRAAIMGILVFSSQILGRQRLSIYSLLLAAYLMIFVNPNTISDIGFQLSFAATSGLLYIRPIFYSSQRFKKILDTSIVGEDIATTISAQIATLPILLANFGIYSIWSVLVNALILWTIPILMVIGGIGGVLGLFFDFAAKFVIFLSLPLIFYFEKVVVIFSNITGLLKLENLPWQIVVGYYLVLTSLVYKLRNFKT